MFVFYYIEGGKFMRKVSIGKQDYESLITSGCFYVDKTYFIKEWWESQDDVTLKMCIRDRL